MRYQYLCSECGKIIEHDRAVDERDYPCECPECNGFAARVLYPSSTPHILNGGGWFKNDFPKGGK